MPLGGGGACLGQRGSGGDNGTLTSTSRVLGEVAGGTETAFVLPELAEVPGALLDPDFVLASGQGAFGIPQHHLSVQGVYESQNFSASGTLGGFARGFGLVGPRGSSGTLRPRLAGQHYLYMLRQLYETAEGTRPGMDEAHRQRIGALSDAERSAVADYLSRLSPELSSVE